MSYNWKGTQPGRKVEFTPKDPHGWVQWKGTDVCMDVHCSCGCHFHIDAEFVYFVECPACNKVYEVNGHVELIEVVDENEIKDVRENQCLKTEQELMTINDALRATGGEVKMDN